MLKRFVILILMLTTAGAAFSESDDISAFRPGESYSYHISWMGLPLARALMEVDEVEHNDRTLMRIRMTAKTYGAYAHIYPVDDVTEMLADPETGRPVQIDLVLNEGDRHKNHLTTFHYDEGVAVFQNRITKDIEEIPIDDSVRDVFTFILNNRTADLKQLAKTTHRIYADGKLYDLELHLKDQDRVRLSEYGRVESTEIEPIADFDGIFVRKGKVRFWISKQTPRILTQMKADVPVGSVTIKLENAAGTGEPFWDGEKENE